METQTIPVTEIQVDGSISHRDETRGWWVRQLANAVWAGKTLDPVILFRRPEKDQYWLADGFHRVLACEMADAEHVPAVVHEGGRREALLYSAQCPEEDGGVELSDADLRATVRAMLGHTDVGEWTNKQIAQHMGTTQKMVREERNRLK
jgi:hypothetical protein